MQILQPYVKNTQLLKCPTLGTGFCDYGTIYPYVSGVGNATKMGRILTPAETCMMTETENQDGQPGYRGELYLAYDPFLYARGSISWAVYNGLAYPGRHNEGNNCAFVDGHAKWMRYEDSMSKPVFWNHP